MVNEAQNARLQSFQTANKMETPKSNKTEPYRGTIDQKVRASMRRRVDNTESAIATNNKALLHFAFFSGDIVMERALPQGPVQLTATFFYGTA